MFFLHTPPFWEGGKGRTLERNSHGVFWTETQTLSWHGRGRGGKSDQRSVLVLN